MRKSILAAVAVLIIPLAAMAGQKSLEVKAVLAQQEQIKADVLAGQGRYASISAKDRETLLHRQQELVHLLEGKESTDELTEAQRVEAFNTLEWIEATINNEPDERMVCVREKTIGSNRMTRICRTESQWAEARERAREQLMRGGACTDLGGAGCTGG
ncbi:hypothetical protein [Luteimonas vadosa]|uniref:Lysozyme inhibitor LprI N-terminal domain-containing protein n=1 Tax=Luteimonas vadosa TaxID=1165507 RepID=A0ABP9DRD4_9GAMM